MVGSIGMSMPGMSLYDHAKTYLNFLSRATNASFSEEVRVLLTYIILGSSSVPRLTGWVPYFIGSTCPCLNSLLLRVSLSISKIKTFKANK